MQTGFAAAKQCVVRHYAEIYISGLIMRLQSSRTSLTLKPSPWAASSACAFVIGGDMIFPPGSACALWKKNDTRLFGSGVQASGATACSPRSR